MAKYCMNCGAPLDDIDVFCPNCGTKNEEVPVNEEPKEAPASEEPKETPRYEEPKETPRYEEPKAAPERNTTGIAQRNIAVSIILSIITCGIYGLYWLYQLNEEMNRLTNDTKATSGGMVILFSIITCGIYGWYWSYKMGEKVDAIKGENGSNKILFLILAILELSIVNFAIIQDTINNQVA